MTAITVIWNIWAVKVVACIRQVPGMVLWTVFVATFITVLVIDDILGMKRTMHSDDESTKAETKYSDFLLPASCLERIYSKKGIARVTGRRVKKTVKDLVHASLGQRIYKYSGLNWLIHHDLVPSNCNPLLCFVHSKSGGQQGARIKLELIEHLHPFQVVDVSETNPELVLKAFSYLQRYRILVCGGDGTVGWILSSVQKVHAQEGRLYTLPPVGILPIGTGNDLAIELGWGHTHREWSSVTTVLDRIRDAESVAIDRWDIRIHVDESPPDNKGHHHHQQSHMPTAAPSRIFQNYFGIGVDASIVLQFHQMRQNSPSLFFHRWMGKLFYGWMGWQAIWTRSFADFAQNTTVVVDGEAVHLPPDTQGIVLLNIKSYGGGSQLWYDTDPVDVGSNSSGGHDSEDHGDNKDRSAGNRTKLLREEETVVAGGLGLLSQEDHAADRNDKSNRVKTCTSTSSEPNTPKFVPCNMSDGVLEVVAIRGSFELAKVKLGVANVQQIAQGSRIQIRLLLSSPAAMEKKKEGEGVHVGGMPHMPMQFDGEPWAQRMPCEVQVSLVSLPPPPLLSTTPAPTATPSPLHLLGRTHVLKAKATTLPSLGLPGPVTGDEEPATIGGGRQLL